MKENSHKPVNSNQPKLILFYDSLENSSKITPELKCRQT